MELTPQQRLYIRKRTAVHDPDPSEMAGELNIVPFLDIVVNVIMFLLATTQAVLVVMQLDAQLPSLGRRVGRTQLNEGSTLNLSVNITRSGLIVFATGGKLAPGCTETQTGRVITVPAANGRLVWSVARGSRHEAGATARSLTQCLTRIKERFPDENQVILSADPEIEFEHVIGAMDSLRGDGPDCECARDPSIPRCQALSQRRALFPCILLSAGQR